MRSLLSLSARQVDAMAAARKVVELPIGERELAELRSIARSRTEPSSRVERAGILLHYRDDPSCYAVGRTVGVTHPTVQRCLARASRFVIMAALRGQFRGLARSRRSRCRHGRGRCPWHARWPRRWDTRMNSGRRGGWPVIAASMARQRGTPAWHGSRRARFASSSPSRR
jgi:hypothetical protein